MKVENPNIFTNILENYNFESGKIALLLIGTSGSGKTYSFFNL
jgi:ABC-type proline/glycine betaine transport system ATPase subunit